MLLTEPLLSCPCCVFGVIVILEDPATTHLQCSYWGKEVVAQNLAIHSPIHPPLNMVQSSCPLCRKAPQSMIFHPHASQLGWCSQCWGKLLLKIISGGPLSALTCCVNARLLSAIKKISPLIYSQSWVGSWVYTTQAMMTFTLIF